MSVYSCKRLSTSKFRGVIGAVKKTRSRVLYDNQSLGTSRQRQMMAESSSTPHEHGQNPNQEICQSSDARSRRIGPAPQPLRILSGYICSLGRAFTSWLQINAVGLSFGLSIAFLVFFCIGERCKTYEPPTALFIWVISDMLKLTSGR